MAQGPICDVYGTSKDVEDYMILIVNHYGIKFEDDKFIISHNAIKIRERRDLCSRALERLERNIERSLTPPAKRKPK